jgi:hypothetical protein
METGHAAQQPATLLCAITASDGVGPLLQRDYWCVIARCRVGPAQLMTEVRHNFCQFAPEQLVQFSGSCERELALGDELDVIIRLAGRCRVRVVHRDAQSTTLLTLQGHPEAGRITFGAYRNDEGDVVFHIRSRARASSAANYIAFMAAGEAMQTNTWTDFVQAVAHTFGEGPIGSVQAETNQVNEGAEDDDAHPTFEARGDDG